MKGFVEGCSTFILEAVCVHIENLALFHTFKVQIFYYNDIQCVVLKKTGSMELFVSKYFFLHLYTIPSFLLKITGFLLFLTIFSIY